MRFLATNGQCDLADRIGGLPFTAAGPGVITINDATNSVFKGGGHTDNGAAEIRYLAAMDFTGGKWWGLSGFYFT